MFKPAVLTALALAATLAAPPAARAGDYDVDIAFHHGRIRHVQVKRRHAPVVVRHRRHHAHRRHHGHHHRHAHAHSRSCRWVPGHHVIKIESVWEPGFHRIEQRPAIYEDRVDEATGEAERILVRPALRVRVWVEGRHVDRKVRVWRRGHWVCVH